MWHLTMFGKRFLFTNQVKLLKYPVYLVLCFDKSLPWPMDIHIFLSQYCVHQCLVWRGPKCCLSLMLANIVYFKIELKLSCNIPCIFRITTLVFVFDLNSDCWEKISKTLYCRIVCKGPYKYYVTLFWHFSNTQPRPHHRPRLLLNITVFRVWMLGNV